MTLMSSSFVDLVTSIRISFGLPRLEVLPDVILGKSPLADTVRCNSMMISVSVKSDNLGVQYLAPPSRSIRGVSPLGTASRT